MSQLKWGQDNQMNQKGISEIVSIVLIILVTISAVALLAGIIIHYTNKKLDSGTECFSYNTGYFQFEDDIENLNYNCYQTISGDSSDPSSKTNRLYGFSIKEDEVDEKVSEKVSSFNLVLTGNMSSTTLNINASSKSQDISELGGARGNYPIVSLGETITYVYNETFLASESRQIYNRADVYVILKSGKVCDISDTIVIRQCSPGVSLI